MAREHLNKVSAHGPEYLFDGYHIVTTSGTCRLIGVFAWDWDGWLQTALGSLRMIPWLAEEMGLPSPARAAFIGAGHASHVSDAILATFNLPNHSCRLPVTLPLAQMVARLNEFSPDRIFAYPSILCHLASEKDAGRLAIQPRLIVAGAELLQPPVRERIEAAFGAPAIDF